MAENLWVVQSFLYLTDFLGLNQCISSHGIALRWIFFEFQSKILIVDLVFQQGNRQVG